MKIIALPSSQRLHLSFTTAATARWDGEYARLKVSVVKEDAITESSLLKTVGEDFPSTRSWVSRHRAAAQRP